jgi:site-specific recombinase XerD
VKAFPTNLGQQAMMESWQADRAQEALLVLYQECITRPRARLWPFRAQATGTGKRLSHGKSFRNEVSSSEVDTRHQAVLSRLLTEIRARHYSPRTEQAFVHWIRRFLTFRSMKSPSELGPEPGKEYLEFLLYALSGTSRLMAGLLYGSGMRLMECVLLRVKGMDFAQNQIMVRDGKGQKDRVTILPQTVQKALREHLTCVKEQHVPELTEGLGMVYL